MRRAGARVALELLGAWGDRALGEQLGLGLAAADADRELGRADAAPGAVGQVALDAPVLERVEGDRAEAPADAEQVPGERQRPVERVELAVDGDPDRLEGALGRDARGRSARTAGSRP